MVLDRQGGPNWFKNWCLAPVIVDPEKDEVYFTPMYYVMSQFSRYIRPGSKRIDFSVNNQEVQLTAVQNPDGSIAVVLLNQNEYPVSAELKMGTYAKTITIDAKAVQTIVFQEKTKNENIVE
jgi:glucosylceramidase